MNSTQLKITMRLGQGLLLAVLAWVFECYQQPAFLQVLANQLWGCL